MALLIVVVVYIVRAVIFSRKMSQLNLSFRIVFYDNDRSNDGRSFSTSHHLHWHIVPVYYPRYKCILPLLQIDRRRKSRDAHFDAVSEHCVSRRELRPLFPGSMWKLRKVGNHNLITLLSPLGFLLSLDSVETDTDYNDYFTPTMTSMMTIKLAMLMGSMIKCGELTVYHAGG